MEFNLAQLEDILGTKIDDVKLFQTAFTHRSYLNEHSGYELPSNERLEFLGDAVLQLISSEFLYRTYAETEGVLTSYRSAIVCTESLAEEALRLNYGEFLFLSKGEEESGGRQRPYILANTFEAVLGALYLAKGYEFCRIFLEKELLYKTNSIINDDLYKDAKSMFQELSQERYSITPTYEVLDSWGADHEKTFKVGVYLNNDLYGEGEGKSKQKAQQAAAKSGLDKLRGQDNSKTIL
jgi:ribonuclease-3